MYYIKWSVETYAYLNWRTPDGHTLMIASKALLTNNNAGRGPSYTEFTPVAQVRLPAATSPKRLPSALAEVPALRDLGYDAVVSQWRGVVGLKGMSEAQLVFWDRTKCASIWITITRRSRCFW